ncbi:protein of unknown function [Burkholderia multivorans]
MDARRHRRDLHLGSGACEGQAIRHSADDVGPGREAKRQGDVRRLRREPQVRARQPGIRHALRQGAGRRGCRLSRARIGMDGGHAAGRGGREGVRRESAGRAGEPRAVCVPDAGRAGVVDVARRRRAIRRREVARRDGRVPEDARHDPGGARRLLGRRRSAVRAEGGALSAVARRRGTHEHARSPSGVGRVSG